MSEDLPLNNHVIAITGRLVSMSHADAADLIVSLGGTHSRTVTCSTSMLVVGEDGLPLNADGSPDNKLRKASEVASRFSEIEIVTESDFLRRINLDDMAGIRRQYTLCELTSIVGVRANLIHSWMRHGLLEPVATCRGISYFDFRLVSQLRSLVELANSGISARRIRAGVLDLARWLDDDSPLELLTAVESHRRCLVVRLKDGRLAETKGQLLFDFGDSANDDEADLLCLPTTPLLERAVDYEEDGELELAAAVYREVLQRGDEEPETRFNFANVLYALGRTDEAIEFYEQALDRDADYAEAWNNLGSAYLDRGRHNDAIAAFHRAIEVRAEYTDAHFNLATTLDDLDRTDESREHWLAYLSLSENQRKSNRVRARRLTARQHLDDENDEPAQILRFHRP